MNAVCCSRQTSALQAARLMRQQHVGDLVVVDDPDDECTPVAVVTDRDLVVEVLGNGLDPAATMLGSLVYRPLVVANESEDISEAVARMRTHGIRRVPVVNGRGRVVGIVTLDDLLRLLIADGTALLDIVSKGQDIEKRARARTA
jgi:CBS domain-containing protein